MNYSKQALLYFPTTVLFVDDDPGFLSTIGFNLSKQIPFTTCNSPIEALALVKQAPYLGDVLPSPITAKEDTSDPYALRTQIHSLHKTLYNQKRFSYISTVVIDYSMPGINGSDFCKQLADNPIKKIMLTGVADYQTAVNLFNQGLIEHFIIKDSPDLGAELNHAIQKLQLSYFENAAARLYDCLPSYFKETNIAQLGLQENDFSEYYLLDASGSTLFIDANGKPTWVIIRTAEEIDSYADIASDQDAPTKFIKALEEKSMLPFFFTDKDYEKPASDWGTYLHPAKRLPGSDNLYFARIDSPCSYDMNQALIRSHQEHLMNCIR